MKPAEGFHTAIRHLEARRVRRVIETKDGASMDIILEDAEEEEECPICEGDRWLRAIAVYERGSCWVIYCADCGRSIEERWNTLP